MPHFKNSQNQLYWLDEGDDPSKWLPADCVQITEEETEAIRISQLPPPPDPRDVIKAEIAQLEKEQLLPRATRDFMLLFMESNFTPEQLAGNPGYNAVKAFDNNIIALRNQLDQLNNPVVPPVENSVVP